MDKNLERWQQFMNSAFVTYQAMVGKKVENREFAHTLGVDPSWTSRWIAGTAENVPGEKLLDQVAAGLELLRPGWGVAAYIAAGKPVKAPAGSQAARVVVFLSMLDAEGQSGFAQMIEDAAKKEMSEKDSIPTGRQLLAQLLQAG